MEETREKIELFRNYYLVCFRSFEQDNMSPTYLEPLNMYIIVFREGILSVRVVSYRGVDLYSCAHTVPLPSDATSTECAPAHQTAQGLHQCHF